MADSAWGANTVAEAASRSKGRPRHAGLVRIVHWVTTVAFAALLLTGIEILISHPRFYWGEAGNANTTPLFRIPIPASRSTVPTGYGYVLPDQNGWSRYLHFEAAWVLVFAGAVYLLYGFFSGHFRLNLLPERISDLGGAIRRHLNIRQMMHGGNGSYNVLQRLTYSSVVFFLLPGVIWTGLAMSPAVASVFPVLVAVLGGQQSARTLHFLISIALVLFSMVHVVMVCLTGFRKNMRGMITGSADNE